MSGSVELLGARFDAVTLAETVDWASEALAARRRGWVCTVNVAILMTLRRDPELARFVEDAARVVVDGQPLVWASRWLGRPLPERVAGVDLVEALAARAAGEGRSVYLLGGPPGLMEEIATLWRARHPGLCIAGIADGFFGAEEAEARARAVAESGADLLFVGMGVPRQERFLAEQWERLGVGLAVGVGGSFEVIGGRRRRAPPVAQRLGLEWMVRLVQEPGRLWRRYLVTNTEFVVLLARALITRSGERRLGLTGGPRHGHGR